MAVYSIVIDDLDILKKVKSVNVNKILIIGCGGCANESLSYTNRLPIYTTSEFKTIKEALDNGKAIPYACLEEAKRIKKLLVKENYDVSINMFLIGEENLCIRKEKKYKDTTEEKYDLILALCCPAGLYGLLGDYKNTKVISLMKTKGQLFYVYEDNGQERKMIFEFSKII